VAIGSSLSLAYCAIFVVISVAGVDSHTHIFIYSLFCACVRMRCTPSLRRLGQPPTQFRPSFTCLLSWLWVTWPPMCSNCARDFWSLLKSDVVEWRSTMLWILERCRAHSSCSVGCGWYDWRRPLSRSAVPFHTLWHYRKLSIGIE